MQVLCVDVNAIPEWVRDFHDSAITGFGKPVRDDDIYVRKFEVDALDGHLYGAIEDGDEVFLVYRRLNDVLSR